MIDRAALVAKLQFIRGGGDTRRFHTVPTLLLNTVGHHSYNVAWLVHLLTPDASTDVKYRLTMAALAHDQSEHITGDMPAPSKRALGIRELVGAWEDTLANDAGLSLGTELSAHERRILKFADAYDGAFFCVEERAMGNQRIAAAFGNFASYLAELVPFSPVEEALMDILVTTWEKVDGGH